MIPLKVQGYSRNVARVGFHSLRHAHITALLEGGIPMDVVRQQAGHASLEIDGPLLPRQQQSVAGRYGRTSRDRQEISPPEGADAIAAQFESVLAMLDSFTDEQLERLATKAREIVDGSK